MRLLIIGLLAMVSVSAALEAAADEESRTEINKGITNPVSTTWSLKLQNNLSAIESDPNGRRAGEKLFFQPTMPVLLAPTLNLITRPRFTLLDDKPYTTKSGEAARTTGYGDTILDLVLSPAFESWLAGLGSTWVFPTANLDETGQGKWQVGPAGVAGYQSKKWLAGIIVQQWWSFAGSDARSAVSEMHLQYLASWFFGDGWSVGTSPTIKFDWTATAGNTVTFPIGLFLAKVVKVADRFPVKLEVQGEYMPVHPESDGEVFNLQLTVTPKLPSPWQDPIWRDPIW